MSDAENRETGLPVGATSATVGAKPAESKKSPKAKKSGVRGRKPAARGKAKAGGKKRAGASETPARSGRRRQAQRPRAETKGGKILELIGRPQGASLSEIMRVTSWQAHSVRGFLSTAGKKHGLQIGSTKTKTGDRVYQFNK